MDLQTIARALGGEISGSQVLAPGPGHSKADRSLSIKLSSEPGDFVVHSFAGDDAIACLDYIRDRLGMPPFKPGSSNDKRTIVFEYRDPATDEVRYRKERIEFADDKKTFIIKPKGRGGSEPLLYGSEFLADLAEGQPVWIVEGEKKVQRLRELGSIAVSGDTGESSKWLRRHAELLRGLDVILWPDSDEPGERYIANAARCLEGHAKSLRVVRPFGPPNGSKGRDVCDWDGDADALARLAENAQPYKPVQSVFCKIINPAKWEGLPVPERKWTVPDYIPDTAVTLLSSDGGQGKSLLALQLAMARALARDWIGLLPEPGRTLVLSAEDDSDEMHRRLDAIRKSYGATWTDLTDIRLIDLVGEDPLLAVLAKGKIEPSPAYQALDTYSAEYKPSLIILDVLADLFPGDESDRAHVRQFINLLKGLCQKRDCSILLLAHPSLAGMNTGTGLSGSTDWNNGVRSRLYLKTPKTEDNIAPNKNLRTFQGMKSNYSECGGKIDLEWKAGVFVRVNQPGGFSKLAAEQRADEVFLGLLTRFEREGRDVSPNPSVTFAPAVFAKHEDAKELNKDQLRAAMDRLLKAGKVKIKTAGKPSKQKTTLTLADD